MPVPVVWPRVSVCVSVVLLFQPVNWLKRRDLLLSLSRLQVIIIVSSRDLHSVLLITGLFDGRCTEGKKWTLATSDCINVAKQYR